MDSVVIQIGENSMANFKPAHTSIMQSSFLRLAKPSSLLAKRYGGAEFGDLLAKKLKTKSTDVSESNSIQDSPAFRQDFDMEEERDSTLSNSPKTVITRASSFEPLFQGSLVTSPTDNNIGSRPPLMSLSESYPRIQEALETLKYKILEQEAKISQEAVTKSQLVQEPIFIPAFLPSTSNLGDVSGKKTKNVNGKKNIKKLEEQFEINYGSIEFPFLSLPTPFSFNDDSTQHFPSLLPMLSNSSIALGLQESLLGEKLAASLSSLSENSKKLCKPISSASRESLIVAHPETLVADFKSSEIIKEEMIEKRNKEKEREKEKDTQKIKIRQQQQGYDDIYSRPLRPSRRAAERKKNKWQVAQDEKVKDIIFITPVVKEPYDAFFEGSKKKSANVPLGPDYQVDVSILALQSKPSGRRLPKLKWDPSYHSETELQKFFKNVETSIKCKISEEEVTNVILGNNNNLKQALEFIRANKAKCAETLAVKVSNQYF